MFKFFKRIRRRLAEEGRLTNYLFYALGEIILVVVGILIALQINNWNIQRMEENQMQDFARALVQDLDWSRVGSDVAALLDRVRKS